MWLKSVAGIRNVLNAHRYKFVASPATVLHCTQFFRVQNRSRDSLHIYLRGHLFLSQHCSRKNFASCLTAVLNEHDVRSRSCTIEHCCENIGLYYIFIEMSPAIGAEMHEADVLKVVHPTLTRVKIEKQHLAKTTLSRSIQKCCSAIFNYIMPRQFESTLECYLLTMIAKGVQRYVNAWS